MKIANTNNNATINSAPERKEVVPVKIEKLHYTVINFTVEQLYRRRRKGDSRGLIDTKAVLQAVLVGYQGYGGSRMPEHEIKGLVNAFVALGYLRFTKDKVSGKLTFFLTFTGLITCNGKTIGTRGSVPERPTLNDWYSVEIQEGGAYEYR